MATSKLPSLQESVDPSERLRQHNKDHDRIILGSNVVMGVTSVTMLAKDGVELTPATLHFDFAGPELVIVGSFAILMASLAKRYGSSSKTQAVLQDHEKVINAQGSMSDKAGFVDLQEDIHVLENLADQSWKKSRNRLLVGLGGAVVASSLSVGAAVITPAVAIVAAGSLVVGLSGLTKLNKTIQYGTLRDKKIQKTSDIKHNALKPKF